ncbi:MAG: Holliday junction resolvase RuvX, partial [Planctomycetes bacterium]|nr:Holliday junction resolvase RuvX [Planctomycetota bacterium]
MGLDVGNVRIGVALSDPTGLIASPHSVIQARSFRADAEAVRGLVEETESVLVVAGIPLNLEG